MTNIVTSSITAPKRSPYVPPPGIHSSASSVSLSRAVGQPTAPMILSHSSSVPAFNEPEQFSSFVNDEQPTQLAGLECSTDVLFLKEKSISFFAYLLRHKLRFYKQIINVE